MQKRAKRKRPGNSVDGTSQKNASQAQLAYPPLDPSEAGCTSADVGSFQNLQAEGRWPGGRTAASDCGPSGMDYTTGPIKLPRVQGLPANSLKGLSSGPPFPRLKGAPRMSNRRTSARAALELQDMQEALYRQKQLSLGQSAQICPAERDPHTAGWDPEGLDGFPYTSSWVRGTSRGPMSIPGQGSCLAPPRAYVPPTSSTAFHAQEAQAAFPPRDIGQPIAGPSSIAFSRSTPPLRLHVPYSGAGRYPVDCLDRDAPLRMDRQATPPAACSPNPPETDASNPSGPCWYPASPFDITQPTPRMAGARMTRVGVPVMPPGDPLGVSHEPGSPRTLPSRNLQQYAMWFPPSSGLPPVSRGFPRVPVRHRRSQYSMDTMIGILQDSRVGSLFALQGPETGGPPGPQGPAHYAALQQALMGVTTGGRLPAALLFSDRDFDENDYEALLALDETIENRKGASTEAIEGIPIVTYADMGGKAEARCPICLEDFKWDTPVRCLPCRHSFHVPCLDTWLSNKATCPICQRPCILNKLRVVPDVSEAFFDAKL
eukprot:jgi/Botrbrau1/2793/Bobra.0125s0005.1